jgi:hypothetical protein
MEHVPSLVTGVDVSLIHARDTLDRTAGDSREFRIHRRLLMTPVADDLESFRSKAELVQAAIDVVESKYF